MSKISKTKAAVLDQFEVRTDEWSFGEFEKALEKAMGKNHGNYQTSKMAIIEADKAGRWPLTVERCIRSNFKAFGSLPVELISIGNRFDLSIDKPSGSPA